MTREDMIIAAEAKEIVRLTTANLQHWTNRMVDIQQRAQNIVKILEERADVPAES